MKSLKMAASIVALALSAAAPLALAHGGGPGWGGDGHGGCPGMMGGSPGMMSMGQYNALNLNQQQRAQMTQIQEQARQKQWDLMGRMRDESTKLHNMMSAEKPDPAAVGQQQMRVADLHRQMLESSIDAHNRINALLTNEQRAQLRSSYGPGSRMDDKSQTNKPANQ
jgi:Spy/CpxP family protein refolding chaperone